MKDNYDIYSISEENQKKANELLEKLWKEQNLEEILNEEFIDEVLFGPRLQKINPITPEHQSYNELKSKFDGILTDKEIINIVKEEYEN